MTPERAFLAIALPFGLALCFGIPPLGGGDEQFHFQRTIEVAYGGVLDRATVVPKGFVQFLQVGFAPYLRPDPVGYTLNDYRALASIPVDVRHGAELRMNAFTVHNPVNYIVPALVVRVLARADPSVLLLFFAARVTSMLVAVTLMWGAIRAIPTHKYALAAIALLPTAVFYRSVLSADGVTIGAAFLFVALALRACLRTGLLGTREMAELCGAATLAGLSKGAYAPLACMLLAIPRQRFVAITGRLEVVALGVIPAFVGGFGWMLLVKQLRFANLHYSTWGGKPDPQAQLAFIMQEPLSFLGILARTVTQPVFIANAVTGVVGELAHSNVFLPRFSYVLLLVLYGMLFLASPKAAGTSSPYKPSARVLGLGIFAGCIALTLLLLYVQWTDVRAPIILGFQGRYLIPVLPLLIAAAPQPNAPSPLSPRLIFAAIAAVGCAATVLSLIDGFHKAAV